MSINYSGGFFPFDVPDLTATPEECVGAPIMVSPSLGTFSKMFWLAKSVALDVNLNYHIDDPGVATIDGTISATGGRQTINIRDSSTTGYHLCTPVERLAYERVFPAGFLAGAYPLGSFATPNSGVTGTEDYTITWEDGVTPPTSDSNPWSYSLFLFQPFTPAKSPYLSWVWKQGGNYMGAFYPEYTALAFFNNLTPVNYSGGTLTDATLTIKVAGCADIVFPLYADCGDTDPGTTWTLGGTIVVNFDTFWTP